MNAFQIVFVLLCAVMTVLLGVAVVRGRVAPLGGILWALLWVAAGLAIARPEITRVVARALGIGRGADLVLYCSVVAMALGFLWVHGRLQELRRELTVLVRELAIRDARGPADGEADREGEG